MTVTTARELRHRVARKFGKRSDVLSFPEHVVLFEVPFRGRPRYGLEESDTLAESLRSRQRYDALAIGVWPSSKKLIHGFELKVTRADLLHELRDLTKSEYAARNVDRFWLVLGDKTLMKDTDPVPESWGVLAAHGRGLRMIREAQPQPGLMDRELLVGAVTRALVHPTIGREVRYRDGLVSNHKWYQSQVDSLRGQYNDLNLRHHEALMTIQQLTKHGEP